MNCSDASASHLSDARKRARSAAEPASAASIPAPLYDSDQVPVLIRLPDLTTQTVPSPAKPIQREQQAAPVGQSIVQDSDRQAARVGERRESEHSNRGLSPKQPAHRSGRNRRHVRSPSPMPSMVLLMMALVIMSGVVFVVMRGTGRPKGPETLPDRVAADGVTELTLEPGIAVVPFDEPPPTDMDLWPRETDAESAGESSYAPPLVAERQDREPVRGTESQWPPAASGGAAEREGRPSGAPMWGGPADNNLPSYNTNDERSHQGSSAGGAEAPIRGWPDAAGSAGQGQSGVWPGEASAPVSPASNFGGTGNSDHSAASRQPARGWPNSWPSPGHGAADGAQLNGTIEPIPPRADYERNRAGLY